MKIKSEYELAHVVSTGLMSYANKVQNGATGAFQKFKEGADSIVVTIGLTDDGEIVVIPYDKKGKIKALEETVKTQKKEIKSLEPKMTYTEAQASDKITIIGEVEPKKPKPRRRET